jgi:adenylate kinase family enzyme
MSKIIFLIGLHGCGKSSIGKRIEEVPGWRSFSVGDLGRSARRNHPVAGISIRTLTRLGQTSPGKPMTLDLATLLVSDLVKHNRVVCDGFPASPEHLQVIPAGSTVVLVSCKEDLRQERLTDRALSTRRSWTPGMPSERDELVSQVFQGAQEFPLELLKFDNSGPLLTGTEILKILGLPD